jgi:hypothetical protein
MTKRQQRANRAEAAMHTRTLNAPLLGIRARVLALDNHTCRMCSFDLLLEVHHIVPRAEGGTDGVGNLIALCPNHHAMADRKLITSEDFTTCLSMRTPEGRFLAAMDLMEYIARAGANADAGRINDLLLPVIREHLAIIYGAKKVNANLDSFLLPPPAVSR